MLVDPYSGPSWVKNIYSFLTVFSEKDVLEILRLILKNDNEGTLAWRSCTYEPTKAEHLTSIFLWFFLFEIFLP